jgi:hypothetical protein
MKNILALLLIGVVMTGLSSTSFYDDNMIDMQVQYAKQGYILLPNEIAIDNGQIVPTRPKAIKVN